MLINIEYCSEIILTKFIPKIPFTKVNILLAIKITIPRNIQFFTFLKYLNNTGKKA